MAEISEPEISIDRLMDKIKDGAARRRVEEPLASSQASAFSKPFGSSVSPPVPPESSPAFTHVDISPLALQPPFEPRADDQYHVNDLLKYHDHNFIENAYRAILKRGPDPTGRANFIEALRQGRLNKIDVLAKLRYSPEGKAKKVQVRGLRLPAMIRQSYRFPVLGYLFQLVVAIARLPNLMRSQQQVEAHVLAQLEQIVDYANQTSARVIHQAEATQQLRSLAAEQKSLLASQQTALSEMRDHLNDLRQHLEARLDEESAYLRHQIELMERRAGEESGRRQEQVERLSQQFRAEVLQAVQCQQQLRAEMVWQGQRVTLLLEEARKRLPPASFDQEQLQTFVAEERHSLDALYVSLEDQFRGERAEIKERLKVYLPIIKQAGIGTDQMPLLDIGSGRGEWLELLREEKLRASGVELNRVLVAQCREAGLEVVENDVVAYLRTIPDASLGAVTGFHIVEHLPFETLIKLLDETVRVVKPNGAVIFETPNPQNVLVGSCNFYFDPTHRNPLPSPIMKFLLESRGFARLQTMNLNPSDAAPVEGDSDLVKRFNEYFYGPMDYAVIGWKV